MKKKGGKEMRLRTISMANNIRDLRLAVTHIEITHKNRSYDYRYQNND